MVIKPIIIKKLEVTSGILTESGLRTLVRIPEARPITGKVPNQKVKMHSMEISGD